MKLKDFDFRIWDNIEKKYLNRYPTIIKDNEDGILIGRSSRFYSNTADMFIENTNRDFEIELWTGFCDINGTKIYENDILENKNLKEIYHITRDDANKMFKIAIYEKESNGELYRRKAEPDISFLKSLKSEKNMEVIGNIHENKELLK